MKYKILVSVMLLLVLMMTGCVTEEKDFSEMSPDEKFMHEKEMSRYFGEYEDDMCNECGTCKENVYGMYEDASLIEDMFVNDYGIFINDVYQLSYRENSNELWIMPMEDDRSIEDGGIRDTIACYYIIPDDDEEMFLSSREPVGQYFLLFIHEDTVEKMNVETMFKKDITKIYW